MPCLRKRFFRVCLELLQSFIWSECSTNDGSFSLVSMGVRSSSELNGRRQLTREKEWPSADDLQGLSANRLMLHPVEMSGVVNDKEKRRLDFRRWVMQS